MNQDQLLGKWKQLRGSVKQQFGKLTDDDLNVIGGKRDLLIGKLQERYGYAREEAQRRADEWMKTLHEEPEYAGAAAPSHPHPASNPSGPKR
ncbi:MAG TPA: CsbD family protein [Bryobacteraceae bacterium]|nr:CsbD family protein [Bryobacteraceae bacterium]